jgi:pimeloyl-ACP methyl ester carboxylesterase
VTDLRELTDLVILIPGITGSVLTLDGRDVWGLSGRAIMQAVRSLGASVNRLKLPAGFGAHLPVADGEGEAPDDVTAPRLMPDLHVIPGLWSPIKGYSALTGMFQRRFHHQAAGDTAWRNPIEFPYDWRLSNVVAARRLQALAVPALERWRVRHAEAKLVLVCHSMGGLVARWFLEVLGGSEFTRWLITIGTPYCGAVNALESLVNGLSAGLGPLKRDLTSLVRTFPSMYELLPTVPCVDVGGPTLQTLSQAPCGIDLDMLAAAVEFHRRINEQVARRSQPSYKVVAIKGIHQPTSQSAKWTAAGLEPLRSYGAEDKSGDGTVPRPSAHPPEWENEWDGTTVFAAQRHGTIQECETVLAQLFGRLTGRSGTWLGADSIGLEVPTLTPAGEALNIHVTADDPMLALAATVTPYDSQVVVEEVGLLTNLGGGRYHATVNGLPPGTYQVKLHPAETGSPFEPLSDIAIIWTPDAF